MSKIEDAKKILKEVGMPEQQQTDIAAYSLLTLADIGPKGKWSTAKNEWTRIHDVLQFSSHYYGKVYAENTRETMKIMEKQPTVRTTVIGLQMKQYHSFVHSVQLNGTLNLKNLRHRIAR